jgi:hypothetical protein
MCEQPKNDGQPRPGPRPVDREWLSDQYGPSASHGLFPFPSHSHKRDLIRPELKIWQWQSEAFEMIFLVGEAHVTSTLFNGEKGRLAAAKGLFVDFIGQGSYVPCARSRLEAKPCPLKVHLLAFLVARRTEGKAMVARRGIVYY